MKQRKGDYEIDTDKRRLDLSAIHRFLSQESYWAKNRTMEQTLTAIENSICFGVYRGREQVGFARIVTDKATFAYIGDVYILEDHRGKGLSKWLMEIMLHSPTSKAFVDGCLQLTMPTASTVNLISPA